MQVRCITIEGENAIVAAADFDQLCELAKRCDRLEIVAQAARAVVGWDWSDNDADCVADIERLRDAVNAV